MVKYLLQLLNDLERSEKQAPCPSAEPFFVRFDDDDDDDLDSYESVRLVKLDELLGIPAIAFPPEKMLLDGQIKLLAFTIASLWKKWQLWYELPDGLTERQRYTAFRHAMSNEMVAWNFDTGCEVKICRFEAGGFCPFGQNGGHCHCKVQDDAAKHDIALWEEHVRSQGLDPYRELSQEEEQAFEAEMRNRNRRKQVGEERSIFSLLDGLVVVEQEETLFEEEEASDDWVERFFWETGEAKQDEADEDDENKQENFRDGFFDDHGFDPPFF